MCAIEKRYGKFGFDIIWDSYQYMSLCLSPREVAEVTGKQRPSAQARVLSGMGIPYRLRPDGTLVVLRIHVEYETTEKEPASPTLRLS